MTAPQAIRDLTVIAARAAAAKKGTDILAIDVSERLYITDVFLLIAAANERQVGAIVDEVARALREAGAKILRREGEREARWVLLDFGDIVVHVQHEEERELYALHKLWGDCPLVDLPADVNDGSLAVETAEETSTPRYVPAPLLDAQNDAEDDDGVDD